jgi:hypothetical protein
LIASSEPNIRERNHPLPLTGSVPPGPPPPATPIKTISNILPPLEAWCPPSNLEPVNPRTAFLLLPSWRPADPTPVTLKPAFRETGKPFTIHKFPAPKKWLVTLAIPILAGVALFRAPATVRGWQDAHQALLDRAAVALHEDFRAGLDDWMNREGARPSWTSDAAGFVHPGALGLYRPSLSLADYQMQFVGTIDKKELSWVVRAADFNNYYEIRLAALKPGRIGVTRYAVINGKIQNRSMTPLAISAQPDTVYRVRLEVRGDQFALSVQDRLVDSWSEPQLRHGGIGFFSEPDAGSRVAGLQVRGHDDILGHLCAFLAPSGVASYRASLNQRAAIVLISGIKASSTAGGDLNSSLAGSAGRRQRGVRLDPAVWQAPEIALTKSRRCQPATTRAGGARVRHIPSGSSSSAPCY